MTTDASLFLRQLGQAAPAARVAGAPQGPAVQAGEFADLLQSARDGTLVSNRPVTVAQNAKLTLSDDQLARLSLAADRAEASGLRRALVTIDEQRVVLDVQNRTVEPATSENGVLEGIDGVIDLAGALIPESEKTFTVQPPAHLENPSLARLLARQNEKAA